MKRTTLLIFALWLGFMALALADQVKVNIVYPINGASYPVTDPALLKLKSAYVTASFSVTCGGGPHKVTWGFDALPALGNATYYDQTSVQQVYKLPAGRHTFWVKCDCGENKVTFKVGG
jgi:hypothetical protein